MAEHKYLSWEDQAVAVPRTANRPAYAARPAVRVEPSDESRPHIRLSVEREDTPDLGDFSTRQLRVKMFNAFGQIRQIPSAYYLNLDSLGQRVALTFGHSESDRTELASRLQEALAESGQMGSIIDVDAPSISSRIWLLTNASVVKLQREGSYRTFRFSSPFGDKFIYEIGETLGGPRFNQPGKLVRLVLESRPRV